MTEELTPAAPAMQIQLFEPVGHQIADRIRNLNLDELRPIEALQLLQRSAGGAEAPMRVAGIMSGTSLDGIDVAIVDISGRGWNKRIRTVALGTTPYPRAVREALARRVELRHAHGARSRG